MTFYKYEGKGWKQEGKVIVVEKVIIFDFDGTIADTLQTIIRIINRLSDKFGYKKVTGLGAWLDIWLA